ncbi:hypothetical protein OEZ85_008476 [Tetradesmus obliquus]|uniref:Uncharacterized protein n=1 Tax=Tetradesmus obliquus TaxID=3088 RepID=A0ABY8TKV7_TETOB|nr:hypothetical protein OEZ85_008476 [Tetradesmus obliquus]
MEYPSSYLATLVQLELAQGSPDPAVRLDCDADEAREIVAVLRQGSRYKPPQDNPRLVDSLRHTLDFMGLPTPHFPCSSFNERVHQCG